MLLAACSSDDSSTPGDTGGSGGSAGAPGDLGPLTRAPSTLEQTLVPKVAKLPKYDENHNPSLVENLSFYDGDPGVLEVKAGDPVVVRAIDGSTPPAAGANAKQLVRYAHLADLQLADDESPTRVGDLDSAGETNAALRPQDPLLCRMTNAAVRTINFEHGRKPIDFVLLGGDNSDSAQTNEVDWAITLLSGGNVECDSGADDDPVPGPGNDGKDPFVAEGLKMPWKWVTGNHDVLVQGNFAISESQKTKVLGTDDGTGTRGYASAPYGQLVYENIVADPKRALLSRTELMSRVADAGDGHGIGGDQKTSGRAFYHFDVPDSPMRFIIMDTATELGGSEGVLLKSHVESYVKPALEEAKTQGKLVILASHHASGSLTTNGGAFGTEQPGAITADEWRDVLGGYDNVIATMVAHSHQHRVNLIKPPGGGHAYWEIMTSAIADFPHEFRVLEVWDQDNGWLMIRATCMDLATENDALAEEGRRRGVIDVYSGWVPDGRGADGERNVELYIKKPGG